MEPSKEIQLAFLEKCVKDYRIFVDTSSFLDNGTKDFLMNITPILEREKKALILPLTVYKELEKLANSPDYCKRKHPDNPMLNTLAIRACKVIIIMQRAHLIDIFADPDDGDFADNVFLHVFTKKRMQFDILLITQDRGLANEAMNLGKDTRAVKVPKKILVRRIDKNGFLKKFFDSKQQKNSSSVEVVSEEIPINERFAFTKEIVQIEGNLPVSKIPTAGEDVIAVRNNTQRQIRLLEELGAGGEGSVYKTNMAGFVAKIYKPEKITRMRYEKLQLMLTKDINCAGVCFPVALILNQRSEFVGYLMQAAKGRDLGKSIFMPMLLSKYFPQWNKIDTVQLCVTILQKLKYLHDRNVILGDINPYNILVVSPTEVYFVDTDSYQVEGFICPVGMPIFTAPELHKKNSQYGLRTLGNENFAVATLLFMIMLPGKPPYAMQDGGGIVENIVNGEFSYPLGELKTGKAPKGPWRYCWSHLIYKIKETFYETFWRDGAFHDEKKRPGSGHWLRLFEYYLELLKNGKLEAQDDESIKIFPSRLKKDKNKTYARCILCNKEYEEERLEHGICRDCLNDGEKYTCEKCGCEMIYTNYQRYIKHAKRYEICRDCFEKKNTIYQRIKCKDCGKTFEITYGEKDFYDSKSMSLPVRCEECRKKPRVTSTHSSSTTQRNVPTQQKTTTYTSPPESSSKKSGWCFITTAVCEYLGKPDDCFELTTLRDFRDNWLANQIGGKEDIREYYRIAPLIVERLAISEEKHCLYGRIYSEYIEPCLEDILHGRNECCRKRYHEMVDMLRQKLSINFIESEDHLDE